jgi:predicted nucleic acid-binding protein
VAFTVVYDADVLHRAPVRDLVVRLALQPRLNLRARWTEQILDEMVASIARRRPELRERLARTRELMCLAVPDCLVTGWEPLVDALQLPDPDDRHVLAAAIRAHAGVIVTYNTHDFPDDVLEPFGVAAQHPDTFLSNLLELAPAAVVQVLQEQIAALVNPPETLHGLLERLRDTHHLVRFSTAVTAQLA